MTIILTTDELERVTGYKKPKRQVQELHRQAGEKGHGKGGSEITTAARAQTVLAFARNQEIITHPVVGRLPRLSSFGGLEGSSCSTTWGLRLLWPTSATPQTTSLRLQRAGQPLSWTPIQ